LARRKGEFWNGGISWGHGASGANLSVADRHAGVNVNLLTDDALIDRLSGCSSLNGVPVTVALTSSRS
jgi:hypothetical protein